MAEIPAGTEILVDPKEAFVDLLEIPGKPLKPTRLQRLGGSPSRWVGLILLALIWVPTIVHWRNVRAHRTTSPASTSWLSRIGTTTQAAPYYTIKKGGWSESIRTEGRNFCETSVTPMVRRVYMFNDNPNWIHHQPAKLESDATFEGVKSIRVMMEPDDLAPEAKIEYSLQ